jgi:hypothetical protein
MTGEPNMKTNNESPRLYQNKKLSALFAGIVILACLVAGCVVTSVYPYYQPKDVSFDAALLGKWIPADATNASTADEFWTFEKINDRTYKLTTIDNKTNHYDAVLFKLRGAMFLDCLPRERSDFQTPSHILLRTEIAGSQLKMELLDYKWLDELIEKTPRAIRHIIVPNEAGTDGGDGQLALTADTAELQKFILKHLKTKEAWSDPLIMKR